MTKLIKRLSPAFDDALWLLYALAGVVGMVAMRALSTNAPLRIRWAHIIVAVVCALLSAGYFELKGTVDGKTAPAAKQRRYVLALLMGMGWEALLPAVVGVVQKIMQGLVP